MATPTSPEVILTMPSSETPAEDVPKPEAVNSMGQTPVSKTDSVPLVSDGCRPSLSCDPGASGMGASGAMKCADDCADEDRDEDSTEKK